MPHSNPWLRRVIDKRQQWPLVIPPIVLVYARCDVWLRSEHWKRLRRWPDEWRCRYN